MHCWCLHPQCLLESEVHSDRSALARHSAAHERTKLVVIIHAFGGHAGKFWYKRLADSLTAVHPTAEVKVLRMTEPGLPKIEAWVSDLQSCLANAAASGKLYDVYLVGHSVGCQTIIRCLALPETGQLFANRSSLRLSGALCVAGWFEVVDPWPTIEPWCSTPIDCVAARQALADADAPLVLIISDNDKYTPDFVGNALQWETHLGAVVELITGRNHFGSRNQVAMSTIIHKVLSA